MRTEPTMMTSVTVVQVLYLAFSSSCAGTAGSSNEVSSEDLQESIAIHIETSSPQLYIYEALPITLRLTNESVATQQIDTGLLSGEDMAQYAIVSRPDGTRILVWNLNEVLEYDPTTRQHVLGAGEHVDLSYRLAVGPTDNEVVFGSPGEYEVSIVLGSKKSNVVTARCAAISPSEEQAFELLRDVESSELLSYYYFGTTLNSLNGPSVLPRIELLAACPKSRIYSSHAKLALADMHIAKARSLARAKPQDARARLEEAAAVLSSIGGGSAIGDVTQPGSVVAKRLTVVTELIKSAPSLSR
jgi:hypothetical protein